MRKLDAFEEIVSKRFGEKFTQWWLTRPMGNVVIPRRYRWALMLAAGLGYERGKDENNESLGDRNPRQPY
jgi:hypothetical protein